MVVICSVLCMYTSHHKTSVFRGYVSCINNEYYNQTNKIITYYQRTELYSIISS